GPGLHQDLELALDGDVRDPEASQGGGVLAGGERDVLEDASGQAGGPYWCGHRSLLDGDGSAPAQAGRPARAAVGFDGDIHGRRAVGDVEGPGRRAGSSPGIPGGGGAMWGAALVVVWTLTLFRVPVWTSIAIQGPRMHPVVSERYVRPPLDLRAAKRL